MRVVKKMTTQKSTLINSKNKAKLKKMVNKDLHLDKVKNTHVKKAAKFWAQQENFLPFHNSNSYDVIIEGKPYPPKAISSKAYEIATGVKILPSDFSGARKGRWHNLLEKLGFQIK